MGDEKKKGGGKGGGTLFKLVALAVLVLIGAEIFAKMTGQGDWSPLVRIGRFIKSAR